VNIRIRQAGKRYESDWIFRTIDLDISTGEKVAALGPNGSGKSTFLQLVSGFVTPSEGTISWTASDGTAVPVEAVYRDLSLAAPYVEVPEEMTFRELLEFHFRFKRPLQGLGVEDILDLSGLKSASGRPVRHYSSGMKQRVRLSLAICSESSLLLLDEPCSNLDASAAAWYRDTVELFSDGRTVLVCSNHQKEEYGFCTRQVDVTRWKISV
jgi:ABC-type multidrug transport system ATPase subunit